MKTHTIYDRNGKAHTGTYFELEVITALSYNRLRDVIKGRRRTACNWYHSREDALRGKSKPGPKKKIRQEATDGTALW